jgi:hypothetical protein
MKHVITRTQFSCDSYTMFRNVMKLFRGKFSNKKKFQTKLLVQNTNGTDFLYQDCWRDNTDYVQFKLYSLFIRRCVLLFDHLNCVRFLFIHCKVTPMQKTYFWIWFLFHCIVPFFSLIETISFKFGTCCFTQNDARNVRCIILKLELDSSSNE